MSCNTQGPGDPQPSSLTNTSGDPDRAPFPSAHVSGRPPAHGQLSEVVQGVPEPFRTDVAVCAQPSSEPSRATRSQHRAEGRLLSAPS